MLKVQQAAAPTHVWALRGIPTKRANSLITMLRPAREPQGRYLVDRVVGEGAYGVVLKCQDVKARPAPLRPFPLPCAGHSQTRPSRSAPCGSGRLQTGATVALKQFKISGPDAEDVRRISTREVTMLRKRAPAPHSATAHQRV